ncbi:MAG: histidinol-phosphate transaminase [Acidimicrobiia bacterium]|nr:MAG: histidinol-phosphate transaminase [Acidimicrobiia bacterium]
MPTYRPDLDSIPRYTPGKPIGEVARELGLDSIDKLASNECPLEPFPEVLDAIAAAGATVNRYPDSGQYELTNAIAQHHDVDPTSVWVGAGSSEVLRCTALSVGGPGTNAVFAHPSFVMYRIATLVAHGEPIAVPLRDDFGHDLDAMLAAINHETTIVYVCNPNNPTGGIRSGSDIRAFIGAVDESVTIIIDEAYAEYVTDPAFESMLSFALSKPNVLVARTFSKIYGLAGLRVGFGVGHPDLIDKLRTTQAPFAVTAPAQVAALAALPLQDRVAERSETNARGREYLAAELSSRGYRVADSQANFVYFEPQGNASGLFEALLHDGVIVRVLGDGVRVTVGTQSENEHFLEALDRWGSLDAQSR